MRILRENDRVRVKSLNIKGKIVYIDYPNIYNHFYSPFQIELDKPYDEHDQTVYRTSIKDIVALKKKTGNEPKKKVKKKKTFDDEWF
jgi:hypothetical protein